MGELPDEMADCVVACICEILQDKDIFHGTDQFEFMVHEWVSGRSFCSKVLGLNFIFYISHLLLFLLSLLICRYDDDSSLGTWVRIKLPPDAVPVRLLFA